MLRLALAALAATLLVREAVAAQLGADWQRATRIEYRLQPDGRYELWQRFDIAVHTVEAARAIAQQSYGWSGLLETLTLVEAATIKPDGRVLPVTGDAVLTQLLGADSQYPSFSDWQVRTVVFPDVQPGDTVHYVIRRTATQSLFPGQFEAAFRLGPLDHLAPSEVVLDLPPDLPVHVGTSHLVEAPAVLAPDGRVIRTWRATGDTGPEGGEQAEFIASTFADYPALGRAFAARALPRSEPDRAVRDLAARLTAGLSDPREQARALYDYVAGQIRYVGLQLGPGRIVPRPAGSVLASGYGDCKDHVVLLRALLSVVGIVSEPVLISSKTRYDLPQPATLDVVDHVILHLPTLEAWIDATSSFAPFGVLPMGEYGKPAIIVGEDGTARLGQVPLVQTGASWSRVTTDLDVGDDGSVSGHMVTEAGGPYAVSLREIADGLGSASDQLRRLGTPGNGAYAFEPPMALSRDNYAVAADFDLEDGIGDQPDRRMAPPAGPTVMVRPGGFLVGDAPADTARVCYSGVQTETIRMHMPDTWRVADLPRDVAVSAGFARYAATWRRDGADVAVERRFQVDAPNPMCSPAEYEAMRPALRAARLDLRSRLAFEAVRRPADPVVAQQPSTAMVRPAVTILSVQRP